MNRIAVPLNEARRRWIYGIALAAAPLLVAANLLTGEQVELWLNLLNAVLLLGASGLAVANVGVEPEYHGKHRLKEG